jgi:hypothetical protein
MLRIEMLPAAEGDALFIEYGQPGRPRRILVDGGPARTYGALRSRILQLPEGSRRLDLVVVTHIDTDHVDGIIRLLCDRTLGVEYGDIWFNGWPQLVLSDTQGPGEGEMVGALLQERGLRWNAAFGGGAVVVDEAFTPKPLPDGMTATVVGPTWKELQILHDDWKAVLDEEGWVAGDKDRALQELGQRTRFRGPPPIEAAPVLDALGAADDVDPSKANAASIALLLEDADGHRCLLTGDSHGPVLAAQLAILGGNRPVKVDAFKLPHHGSRNNVSTELLDKVDTRRYLVSSSGAKYQHPDRVAIERVLARHDGERRKPVIVFNYRSPYNEEWANPERQRSLGYVARYPEGNVVEA